MKITDVECLILDRSFPFVRVFTDEGIVGIGECFRRQPRLVKTIVDEILKPALLGRDPTDTTLRFNDMQRARQRPGDGRRHLVRHRRDRYSPVGHKGQGGGRTHFQAAGRRNRDKIRMYASSMRRDMTPLEEGRRAASFVEQGYTAYKLHSAVPGAMDDSADHTIATVTEVRAAVGDGIDILVDVNGAYSVHRAIEVGKALETLGVFHFEEPRPYYDLEGLAEVADALDIPVASGEMIYTRYEYRDLILKGRADIIQPDIVKAPGFTEFQKIAALCETFGNP